MLMVGAAVGVWKQRVRGSCTSNVLFLKKEQKNYPGPEKKKCALRNMHLSGQICRDQNWNTTVDILRLWVKSEKSELYVWMSGPGPQVLTAGPATQGSPSLAPDGQDLGREGGWASPPRRGGRGGGGGAVSSSTPRGAPDSAHPPRLASTVGAVRCPRRPGAPLPSSVPVCPRGPPRAPMGRGSGACPPLPPPGRGRTWRPPQRVEDEFVAAGGVSPSCTRCSQLPTATVRAGLERLAQAAPLLEGSPA